MTMWVALAAKLVAALGPQETLCFFRNSEMVALSASEYPESMNILGLEGAGPECFLFSHSNLKCDTVVQTLSLTRVFARGLPSKARE